MSSSSHAIPLLQGRETRIDSGVNPTTEATFDRVLFFFGQHLLLET